ncbi:hypothetical protein [Urbifossiella limnaea]|uniref:Uncharacterized protein n=1 Tax=Urbifossiella limnaea TaxID=2528023 RepID=A0A517XT43_9BACT|nr:hypothetical protein [Urbifossiella limnaea]QDU20663.1 hypothetical protein ETAA1_26200 [Urbifossiella limnaea]
MTAVALLESLAPYRPIVEDGELVVELDPPAGLVARLEILHTGVRAVLSGRGWQGGAAVTRDRLTIVALDPAKPIPPSVTLLRVEGDSSWDRVPASARSGAPDLFVQPRESGPTRLGGTPPVWDATAAIALLNAGDDLVERLDVSGSDPAIQRAAEMFTIAYRARDLDGVRLAARRFEDEVRRVAGLVAPS